MLFRLGSFLNIALCLALIISPSAKAFRQTVINRAYFNSPTSFVFEVDGPVEIEKIGVDYQEGEFVHKYKLNNTKTKIGTNKSLKKSKTNKDFSISLKNKKLLPILASQTKQDTELRISSSSKVLDLKVKNLLENSAYEITLKFQAEKRKIENGVKLKPIVINPIKPDQQSTLSSEDLAIETPWIEAKQRIQEDPLHQLYIKKNSKPINSYNKILKEINDKGVLSEIQSKGYQESLQKEEESAQLSLLADTLIKYNKKETALRAYKQSLELNPNNLATWLKLAKNSSNKSEKLNSYLKTISTDALTSIGSSWLEHGLENNDPDSLAAALVSFQYAVLKNPLDPKLRYTYARALEKSGTKNTSKSARRYLEAAALSKQQFLHGNNDVLQLMRDSIESLIRLTLYNGDFEKASAYCDSYVELGFKDFLNGKSINSIKKLISKNQNPFMKEEITKYNSEVEKYKIKLLKPNFIDYPSIGEDISFEIIENSSSIIKNNKEKKIINGKVIKTSRNKILVHSEDTLWQFDAKAVDSKANLFDSTINGALIGAMAVGISNGIASYGIANGAGATLGALDGILKETEKDVSFNLNQNDLLVVNKRRKLK